MPLVDSGRPLDAFPFVGERAPYFPFIAGKMPPYGVEYGGPLKSCLPAPSTASPTGDDPYSNDQLSSESRQVTPVFIPGVQDHYTGVLDAAKMPPGLEKPPKISSGAFPDSGNMKLEALKDDTVKHNDIKKLDDMANQNDVKKLESLIWLYLHTAKEGDDASPKASDSSVTHETSGIRAQETPEASTPEPEVAKEEVAPPPAVFSCGSVGHPDTCAEACKYARKKRGCKDGLACSRCHLCTWYHKRNPKPSEQDEIDGNAAVVELESTVAVAVA